MTLTEAQQKGCVPVVMDTFSSLHDIVADGRNGFIVPDGDLDVFVERMERLMTDVKERDEMAWNAVRDSRRFKMEHIGPKWVELFEALVKE